jgi:hypothetical protein
MFKKKYTMLKFLNTGRHTIKIERIITSSINLQANQLTVDRRPSGLSMRSIAMRQMNPRGTVGARMVPFNRVWVYPYPCSYPSEVIFVHTKSNGFLANGLDCTSKNKGGV